MMLEYMQVSSTYRGLYGKPHMGAYYSGSGVNSHRLEDGALCAVCGRRAQHAHHCPPKSVGKSVILPSEWGKFVLMPSLIALCAQCHADVHARKVEIRWVWDDMKTEEEWESGRLLSHGYPPHSPRLLELGRWHFARMGWSWIGESDG